MTAHADRVYLEHILECTALIQDYTRNGKAEFMASSLVRDNEAIGSVQKNLNLETIARIKFVVPDLKAHKDSVLLFRNFGERIIANKQQIQTLTKTRDVLLPKLMSGKLRITE